MHRRELLDLRGQYAQWSILLAIFAVKTLKGLTAANTGPNKTISKWDRPLFAGWAETRRQYLVCGLWLSWLFGLSVWNSGEGMRETFLGLSLRLEPANR